MNFKKLFTTAALVAAMASLAGCGASTTNTATDDAADTAATESDLAYVQDKGTMTIGYTIINPLNYDDENGELVGFETEFAKAVSEKLGVEAEFQLIDWESKEMELNAKRIDCIWNGMTITPERKENMSVTEPYMENRQVLVVKAENEAKYTESLEGASVIAESGSTGEELAENAEGDFAGTTYTSVTSQATALMDIKSGVSDVAVIDYTMALGSLGEGSDYTDLVYIDKHYDTQNYGVAFRKGSDITEEVNNIMNELKADGTLDEIAAKYNLNDLLIVE